MLDLKRHNKLYIENEDFEIIEDLTIGDERYDALKVINIPSLHDLVVDILNDYGDEAKLTNANKVFDILKFMLNEKNLYVPGQSFLNILIASCMLHNIVDVEKWNDVFEIRNIINKYKDNYSNIPSQAIDSICETIEGQLGEAMPIKGCRPNPNTPGELFTLAVALTNRYI